MTYIYTFIHTYIHTYMASPNGLVAKEFTCNAGDTGESGLIPGLG